MYLGIDIGTSGVKAVLMDADGTIVAQGHSSALLVSRPYPDWSEQDPAHWWTATQEAVMALPVYLRSGVKAVGLSGQMHGAVCLEESDKVIRPAILWNDGRSAAECSQMMGDMPTLSEVTGNLAMPGFTAPKLVWMREHEPENFARIAKILLPKDYIRLLMCGTYASDMSDSAGTLWLDVGRRNWSDDVLGLCDLSREQMPELFEGSEATGVLRQDIADAWGMARVQVAGGGGDNAAGAVGSGTIEAGTGFVSLGTSGVIFVADDHYLPNPDVAVHAFCHALPGLWHRMSVILSAASAVDHVAKLTGFADPGALFDAVNNERSAGNGPLFLPYLSGERTPHNDPSIRGSFVGLSFEDTPVQLGASALEGVVFALADGWDALTSAGSAPDTLSIIGGGSRSDYWAEIIASTFNCAIHIREGAAVGPALGAARLAQLCASKATLKEVCTAPAIVKTISPDNKLSERLAPRRETFKKLYPALQELMP